MQVGLISPPFQIKRWGDSAWPSVPCQARRRKHHLCPASGNWPLFRYSYTVAAPEWLRDKHRLTVGVVEAIHECETDSDVDEPPAISNCQDIFPSPTAPWQLRAHRFRFLGIRQHAPPYGPPPPVLQASLLTSTIGWVCICRLLACCSGIRERSRL